MIFTILEARSSDIDSTGRTEAALFVSEMSQELTEKEEQDDESDLVLTEDEVREVLAPALEEIRQGILEEKLRRGFGRPSNPARASVTRMFRAEVQEMKLRTKCNHCGMVGHWARECPEKRTQSYNGGGRENYLNRKSEHFSRIVVDETQFCDWSQEDEPRFTFSVERDTPAVAAEHVPWPGS